MDELANGQFSQTFGVFAEGLLELGKDRFELFLVCLDGFGAQVANAVVQAAG
jgi:hypothetical protein